tara:strand:- start:95 stop:706 length:612 start_codon:yes stop_codon:yes gene_type:complete
MVDNFMNNTSSCENISDIKPALFNSNNRNPSHNKNLPIFSYQDNIFTSLGNLWCMNSENQNNCKQNKHYILTPKYNENFTNNFQDVNNLAYSDNILSNISNISNSINIGKKYNSTGTNVNNTNTFTTINTNNNPYPYNVNFTSDNISFSQLNEMAIKNISKNNNKNIENRFRPVYFHIPDQFLEQCQPVGYQSINNYKTIHYN